MRDLVKLFLTVLGFVLFVLGTCFFALACFRPEPLIPMVKGIGMVIIGVGIRTYWSLE